MVLLFAGGAAADVPPPDDQKPVSFAFTVTGMGVAPDRVLFAYPCSSSNGAPYLAQQRLEEGRQVNVGRRGGLCAIYAIARPAYETWVKEHPESSVQGKQADFDKLVAGAVKCSGAPTPVHYIAKTDARTSIVQTLEVTTLNESTCALKVQPIAPESASPASNVPASKPSGSSKGCAFAGSPAERPALGTALLALIGIATWRRAARSRTMERR